MRDEDLFKPLSAKSSGGLSYANGGRQLTETQKRKSEDHKIRAALRRRETRKTAQERPA